MCKVDLANIKGINRFILIQVCFGFRPNSLVKALSQQNTLPDNYVRSGFTLEVSSQTTVTEDFIFKRLGKTVL